MKNLKNFPIVWKLGTFQVSEHRLRLGDWDNPNPWEKLVHELGTSQTLSYVYLSLYLFSYCNKLVNVNNYLPEFCK